jgi:DNA-binding beta-propeller fold protein YncE
VVLTASRAGYRSETRSLVVDQDQRVLFCLDPEDQLVECERVIDTGRRPKQVAFTPDGRELWVTNLVGPPSLQIFDPATGELLDSLRLGRKGAVEVIFNGDGSRAYVTQLQTASVFEIDTSTRSILRQLRTGSRMSKMMALSPDETRLYVSNWGGDDVTEFNLQTGKRIRRMRTAWIPRGLYMSGNGQRLYVASFGDGLVEEIDLTSGRRSTLARRGIAARHIAGDEGRQRLFVSDMAANAILEIHLETRKTETFATTDENPNTIVLSPDKRILFVANRGRNGRVWPGPGATWGSILLIDAETGVLLDAIVGGDQSTGLAVSPDGALLAFSDFEDDRVRIYSVPALDELRKGGGGRAESHLADLEKRRRNKR